MTQPLVRRARSFEAKQDRERAILDATRELVGASGVRAVTLTQVAASIGMHKSALLRYFETREQILLLLAAEGWVEWSARLRDLLGAMRPDVPSATVAAAFAESLVERPTFCDLLAHVPLSLERHVSVASVRRYKLTTGREVRAIADELHRLRGTSARQGTDLVATAVSLAGAFWQMATPAEDVAALYRSDPDLAHAVVDVGPRLRRILTAQLTGYRATPD